MRVDDFVPFDDLRFKEGFLPKPRMYTSLGQAGPIEDVLAKVKALLQQNALYLVAIGGVIGVAGSVALAGTPMELTVTVAGGVILAAGLLPLILGAMA